MKPLAFLAFVLAAPAAGAQLTGSADPESSRTDAAVPDAWVARITEDMRREEYAFSPIGSGAFGAPNRAQELRSRVSAQGLEVFPRSAVDSEGAPWRLSLRTRSFGRMDSDFELSPAVLEVHGERAELEHGPLVEWLENRADGIEQGWTIAVRPTGSEPLWIGLELGGDLALRIDEGARSGILVDSSGGTRLRYTGLRAFDASGRELDARLFPSPGGVGIRVDDAGATYPLTVDPLLTGGWTVESDQVGGGLGISVSTAGDVNRDGYSDVIIGASGFDNGQQDEGRAYVHLGSASGLAASPAWTAESDQAFAGFGCSVATAGDVNGDGYSDVIVGANAFDNGQSDEGRAYVYLGSPSGLATSPAWTAESDQAGAEFGTSVATAGDVNNDGYSDVVVGAWQYDNGQLNEGRAYVYLGSASGLSSSPAWTAETDQAASYFGYSVSTAGDVNGDGYCDVIVGAWQYDNGQTDEGRAFVYLGSASGLAASPAWTAESNQAGGFFGRSVGTAGDVNGDGYADVITAAYQYDNPTNAEGLVYVYFGGASGLGTSPWTDDSDVFAAELGWSVATAGDVNGDRYSDVIIGAHYYHDGQTEEGGVFVYLGSPSGLPLSPSWRAESDQASAELGWSVSTAGDVNGDGYSDVVVGAPFYDNGQADEGRAHVFHGSPGGLRTENWFAEAEQVEAYLGASVAMAGDVNGDGYSDVIVGAPVLDNGQVDEGCALVYLGSANGLAAAAAWTTESNQAGAQFGWSVSTAGDVNGDGYSDVIVGARYFDNGLTDEGRAYVYLGSASGLATSAAWTAEANQASAHFGWSVSTAGDVNGDGYSDVLVGAPYFDNVETEEGLAYVYLGSASGLAAGPAWIAETDQAQTFLGVSVSTAGDVNADGYSDVIVGAPGFDGRALVFLGSAIGLAPTAAWTAEGSISLANFGYSVSTAGDVNGDGYSDVIVGAPFGETDLGHAYVYQGSASGLAQSPAWTADDGQAFSDFGYSVSTAGDVNGDGYSDVIVGAALFDNGTSSEGRACVYHGSASGLSSGPDWTAEGNLTFCNLGWSVSTAGDVDGDSYSDVIVGVPGDGTVAFQGGGARVYLGNEGRGGWILAPQQRRLGGLAPIALLGRMNSTTSFQIRASFERSLAGFDWATPATPTLHLEWEIEPSLGGSFDGVGIQYGESLVFSGSPLTFDEIVEGHSLDTPYRWRARLRTNNPLLPVTPWFSVAGNGRTETKVRTPHGVRMKRMSSP